MLSILIWVIVLIALLGVVYWFLQQVPLPPMVKVVVTALLAIIAIIIVAKLLMGVAGAPPGF